MIDRRQRVGIVLLVTRVARRAAQPVVVVHVAVRTLTRRNGMGTRQRKTCAGVVERCIQPRARVVALFATLREIRGHVVRIRRSLVILQMTAHASGSGEAEIVGDVAIGALPRRYCVHAG